MFPCEINLVLMSNPAGVPGVAVTVRSVLEHCTGKCNVFVLSSSIPIYLKERLRRSWNTHNIGIIHFIDVDYQIVKSFRPLLHLHHKETYLRLFMGELLPPEIDRCILLGLDLIVTDDLCKINQIDLQGHIIAAALDISAKKGLGLVYKRELLGLRHPERYFNGDLLVVDLVAWRQNDIGPNLQKYAAENYDKCYAADQDPLNVILQDKWLELEQRWNLSQYSREITLDHKGIIHLIGPSKPWHPDYNWKFQQHFFDVLDKTDFKGWRPAKLGGLAVVWHKLYHRVPTFEIFKRKLRKEFRRIFHRSTNERTN